MPRLVLKFRDLFSFGGWEWGAGEGTAGPFTPGSDVTLESPPEAAAN